MLKQPNEAIKRRRLADGRQPTAPFPFGGGGGGLLKDSHGCACVFRSGADNGTEGALVMAFAAAALIAHGDSGDYCITQREQATAVLVEVTKAGAESTPCEGSLEGAPRC